MKMVPLAPASRTKVQEIVAQLSQRDPKKNQTTNAVRLKILRTAATYGWKAMRTAQKGRGEHAGLKCQIFNFKKAVTLEKCQLCQ